MMAMWASIGPTGEMLVPWNLTFDNSLMHLKSRLFITNAGADIIIIETMVDL